MFRSIVPVLSPVQVKSEYAPLQVAFASLAPKVEVTIAPTAKAVENAMALPRLAMTGATVKTPFEDLRNFPPIQILLALFSVNGNVLNS